jgi:transposase
MPACDLDRSVAFCSYNRLEKPNTLVSVFSGEVQRNRLKILFWDGTGLWCCGKRLERGCFSWPSVSSSAETKVLLSHGERALLLGGIDLSRTRRKEWYRREEPGDKKAA